MRHRVLICVAFLVTSLTLPCSDSLVFAEDPILGSRIAVWDTNVGKPKTLVSVDFSQFNQWTRIPRSAKVSSFRGDTVITAGHVAIVVRKWAATIDVYSVGPKQVVLRSKLSLVSTSGQLASRLTDISLAENTRGAARIKVAYKTSDGADVAAELRVKRGDISIELKPGNGAGRLRVACPGRFAILPDFFADDIVLDAQRISNSIITVPSENFLLQPTGRQDAIVMSVFENRDQEVRLMLEGEEGKRTLAGSEIKFGSGGKIWVALLDAPAIWHAREIGRSQAGQVLPLDWKPPFPAQWRIDFTRSNQLVDSWEMVLPDKRGDGYVRPNWLGKGTSRLLDGRKRWTTVLGWFSYPFWIDRDGQTYVQPLKNRSLVFDGPAILYPIHRLPETPLDQFTVVDVVRNTLGVGPCEYILDVEGQKQQYKGRATCATRDALLGIYGKKQQKQSRKAIEQVLDDGLTFVKHIRGRIEQYVQFGHELREYLTQQKTKHPELASFLDDMDQIASEFDKRFEEKRDAIQQPQVVATMNAQFRKTLLDADGPETLAQVKKYGRALTHIGGNQDELVGQCRWIAKMLRQRAGIWMTKDPACATIAKEIRTRCQKIMLKPASFEAARH